MTHRQRDYIYYDAAISICSTCYRRLEAKIVFQDGRVYMLKQCPEHGPERVLVADDLEYYRRAREVYLKPPEQPLHYNTPVKYGCPYDCGLCPDHEQHSCVSLIEVTDACNLECPICYAASGPAQPHRSLEEITKMLDAVVRNEGEPDVVQISGGEPTIHPQFFEILDAAKARPIQHLMVNSNGIRIAKDRAFAERLATYSPGFELYLQFDSFERDLLMELRGVDLRESRMRAIEMCNELDIAVNLVCTVKKGGNDAELGKIVEFALEQSCVRGVTFQPVQVAGRTENFDPATDRLTLTEVRRGILEQTDVFAPEDIIPVPCHPDCVAMAYALKLGGEVLPLSGMMPTEVLLEGSRNTISFESDAAVRGHLFKLFSTANSPESGAGRLRELLCCLPKVDTPDHWTYRNLFRIVIMQFLDAHSFDVRSVKKSCVHIVHPDGRLIPFDNYNLFYRGDLERRVLDPLRRAARPDLPVS